ncbi:MAG TPA: ShlB/FhaC/HecB family hemolysin secretion/activation protein [Candidatus Eisenbacteria bacterium]|nr:ShlB/FhaC/HecB family hemolysin secretion/activation protein [Candidatus Eisenbacteria bacterium]
MTLRPVAAIFGGTACLLLLSTSGWSAQVPSRDTAGAEESRFKERRSEEKPASAAPAVVESEKPAASAEPSGPMFKVTEIRLSGNYSIPDAELLPFADPLLKGDTSLAAIRAVVEEMKKYYRSKGFPAAYVYVPPQQVQDGRLKIEVLEGRLGQIKVGPTQFFSEDLVRRQFSAKPGDVLRYEPLRRDLARINENPDLKAKAVLSPGAATGTTDIEVETEERYPVHFGAEINNSGTDNTGENRYGLNASNSNLFGNTDRLNGSVQWGEGVQALGAGYELPLLDSRVRAGYSYSYATVDVGGSFAALDVEGFARTHRFYLTRPVWESEDVDVDATLGYDVKSVENKLLGEVFGKDELREPNAEIALRQHDDGGSTFFLNRLTWGLADFAGSSRKNDPRASRAHTGGDFISYRGTLARYQKLPGDTLLSVRGTLQMSPDALAPSEQISLGGARSVRGYQEGEYLGDNGEYVSVDFYYPAFFLPDDWRLPHSKETVKQQVQGILFADAGRATLRYPLAGEKKDREPAGVGLGFRVHLYDKMYARLEWAFPIGDRALDGRSNSFYFTVSYDFF